MNDYDEFAEIALAIFVGLTGLIWLLTYLERTLLEPTLPRQPREASDPGEVRHEERVESGS
jgi:hypothetical protein